MDFLGAKILHFGFMIRGLSEVREKWAKKRILLIVLRRGDTESNITEFVVRNHVQLLVSDFSPLTNSLQRKSGVQERIKLAMPGFRIEFVEVDVHNAVSVWIDSDKIEYPAGFRPKIHKHLDRFLVEHP